MSTILFSLRDILAAENFTLESWNDVTATATEWFRQVIHQTRQTTQSVLAVRALKDRNAALMTNNMLGNLEAGRIRVVNGIATA